MSFEDPIHSKWDLCSKSSKSSKSKYIQPSIVLPLETWQCWRCLLEGREYALEVPEYQSDAVLDTHRVSLSVFQGCPVTADREEELSSP